MIYIQLNLYLYNLIIHQYKFELIYYNHISGHIQLQIASVTGKKLAQKSL